MWAINSLIRVFNYNCRFINIAWIVQRIRKFAASIFSRKLDHDLPFAFLIEFGSILKTHGIGCNPSQNIFLIDNTQDSSFLLAILSLGRYF